MKAPIATVLASLLLLQGCAAAVVATTAGAVTAATDRRTIGSQIDDNNIEIKSVFAIKELSEEAKNANISVASVNGIVLLVGQVRNDRLKADVENSLKGIEGIRQVHNQLRVNSNISINTKTHDVWLTSKVKSRFLTTENISFNNIKVITENGEVFLLGLVSKDEAALAVELARNINGVERVIKVFEYL